MNNEVFGEISFPEGIAGEDKLMQKMSLVVFGETLCLIQHCKSYGEPPHCSIWMMKQYGVADSWVRQIRIDLSGGFFRKPIGMRKNGEVLLGTREDIWFLMTLRANELYILVSKGTTVLEEVDDCSTSIDLLRSRDERLFFSVAREGEEKRREE
ncbi:hypothetical protein LOK49_LG07G01959 [Camellia lanceoleosa]|uniref:Uncharacterized protein n=1 Tax=Camellia lanceoleosa TaxID=1840588 RepID=A0ACC0H2I5_9ERIC|nr:hypothetical protein LOK49_LG07G01959 [Camellia lanceoleosa]